MAVQSRLPIGQDLELVPTAQPTSVMPSRPAPLRHALLLESAIAAAEDCLAALKRARSTSYEPDIAAKVGSAIDYCAKCEHLIFRTMQAMNRSWERKRVEVVEAEIVEQTPNPSTLGVVDPDGDLVVV